MSLLQRLLISYSFFSAVHATDGTFSPIHLHVGDTFNDSMPVCTPQLLRPALFARQKRICPVGETFVSIALQELICSQVDCGISAPTACIAWSKATFVAPTCHIHARMGRSVAALQTAKDVLMEEILAAASTSANPTKSAAEVELGAPLKRVSAAALSTLARKDFSAASMTRREINTAPKTVLRRWFSIFMITKR